MWGEGYVDGADSRELSIRRSRQLQEIFIAMIANRGVTGQSSEAPAENAMSPQDLTPTEGFYMCSMTCSFATGAGYLFILERKTVSSLLWINKSNFLIWLVGLSSRGLSFCESNLRKEDYTTHQIIIRHPHKESIFFLQLS